MRKRRSLTALMIAAAFLIATRENIACTVNRSPLEPLFATHDLVVMGDVKHGVRDRVAFFSSEPFFSAMARSGVKYVAIEMPRVLGRQALGVETEADVGAFAEDVVNSGAWHFVDPDHPDEENETTQRFVASAMARQVLWAKRLGITPIFYDFNNPLGGFGASANDPVYRCLTALSSTTWVRYGLDKKITKDERDAAIMRERFSHDKDLAHFIVGEVEAAGRGKLVVIPGFAHAVLPEGLTEQLEARLNTQAAVVAVFSDAREETGFPDFLREQAQLLKVDLSRTEDYSYRIADNVLTKAPRGVEARIDASKERIIPAVCYQLATMN